jgi:regulatory protein
LTEAQSALKSSLRRGAMDLLARREHSRAELASKLARKHEEGRDLIPQVLDQLEADKLLSDARFAEAYVRYRRNKGFGPLLIGQELRQRGITGELLETSLDSTAAVWQESLQALLARKSKGDGTAQTDTRTRQKLFRFCLSRGFNSDQVYRAII